MSSDLKQQLVARAATLGFDECRVTSAAAPPHGAAFRHWLERGSAGEMAWLARGAAKRSDPQLVLDGAKSVVVVALNYWQGNRHAPKGGRIARYAWGDDYHDVFEPKLRELAACLAANGGTQCHYVDTGPVLERDFAAEAGVGWQGKSTMLINQRLGTWFFLGVILTTLELPPDTPHALRCGSCTRCITACPTYAITAPYQLDARRCVSYLTIELKGAIPVELRPLIGDRIYGCDDCLAACPWNRFAVASRESRFALRASTQMQLRDYLALDDATFRVLFRRSPIKRIKRRGFLRNVCVALGNVGNADDLPALRRAAADPEPLIVEHARWAIETIEARLRLPQAVG